MYLAGLANLEDHLCAVVNIPGCDRSQVYQLQITDYRLAPSKWGAREEPTSAPWATIEDTLSS
jgi:hypothetical protein